MDDQTLLEQLNARREHRLVTSRESYAPRNPIASDLHDCRRYQVMRIVAWRVRETFPTAALERMEAGRVAEPAMIRQLQDEGWEVVEYQAPFEINQPLSDGRRAVILRGKLDGKIRLPGVEGARSELVPFDTKETSEHVVERCETEADLLRSPWTRKWRRQVLVYCLGEENERGLLFLGHRGRRRAIVIRLDYAEAEEILKACAWTVETVAALEAANVTHETVDEALNARGVPYHSDWVECKRCPFRDRSCFPPQPRQDAPLDRSDLSAVVARFVELRPLHSEYERVQKFLKSVTEGHATTLAGPYVIDGYVQPVNVKPKPATPGFVREDWRYKVRGATPDTGEEPR